MPGPAKKTKEQKYQEYVRTQAWLSFLIEQSGAKSANHLALMMEEKTDLKDYRSGAKDSGTKWFNYSREKNPTNPNHQTLCDTDILINGSRRVYESGPEGTSIYSMMWESSDEIFRAFDNDVELDWVKRLLPNKTLKCASDYEWRSLIDGLYKFYDECDHIVFESQTMEYEEAKWWKDNGDPFWWNTDNPLNHLQLFCASLGLLKIIVAREKFVFSEETSSFFELITKSLDYAGVKVTLRRYELYEPVLKVIYQQVLEYVSLHMPDTEPEKTLCELSWIPSYENFVSHPMKSIWKVVQSRGFVEESAKIC